MMGQDGLDHLLAGLYVVVSLPGGQFWGCLDAPPRTPSGYLRIWVCGWLEAGRAQRWEVARPWRRLPGRVRRATVEEAAMMHAALEEG
jgi:hypothetical protein